jgi:hypothetical protein
MSAWAKEDRCRCYKCCEARDKAKFGEAVGPVRWVALDGSIAVQETSLFIVCEFCGNKRCPHGTDHTFACTRSNAQSQPGSRYA